MLLRLSFHRICTLLLATVLGLAALRQADAAITINLAYDTSAGNFPSFDPTGSKLKAISEAAADIWKDLLPFSNNSYGVTIHWAPFGAGNTTQLAVYNDFDHTISVRNDNFNPWFLDPTPTQNEEYSAFTQVLYRDSGYNNTVALNGPVPDLLETGYFANAIDGSAADGADDLLSVMTHEMGHFIEIGFNLLKPDVDLSQAFLGGRDGVKAKRADESHILLAQALMTPAIPVGRRRLPSAADVIVAAHEQNHSDIRLRRVDWIGDVDSPITKFWFWSRGWDGGRKPNSNTEVTIRDDTDLTVISEPGVARTLLLAEESTLTISDNLSVNLDAEIRGSGLFDHPRIVVNSTGVLSIGRNLDIGLGGLEMAGGSADIGGLLILDKTLDGNNAINTSSLAGHGTVKIGSELRNRSRVAGEGGTLQIDADAGATLDLDGNQEATQPGSIVARDGNLFFNGPLHDEFNSGAFVYGGHSIRFAQDWKFGSDSTLIFSEGAGLAEFYSTSPTSHVTLAGTQLFVDEDTTASIRAATITLDKFNDAYLFDNSILSLNGEIEFLGGKYDGGGTLRQNGNATVLANTTIDVAQYDWDGFNLPTYARTTVAPNAKFTLNVDGFGGAAVYNGRADLENHSELAVNITSGFGIWRLGTEGSIRFVENARLKGSPVIVQGALEAVDGSNHVDVNATLTGTSLVTVHNGAQLSFHDHVAYGGGSITTVSGNLDNSLLHQFATGNVLEHHTVTVGFFDWDADNNTDSHTTIQPDGFFDIKAKQIGNGITDPLLFFLARSGFGDTIDINGGKLGVEVGFDSRVEESFPHYWTLNATGVMNLNREGHSLPAVQGSKLINYGLISGTGTFFNELQNKAAIRVGHASEIGLIQMMNGFQQTAEGTMAFELAGLAPTTEFDQVYHDAEMSLAGTLEVDLIGGFQPSPGDIFRIILGNEMAPISGTFSTTQLPPGEWDVIYGSTYVDLRFNAVPEPATVSMAAFAAACGAFWNARRRLMKARKEANDRRQG